MRNRIPSVKLRDFITHTIIRVNPSQSSPASQSSSSGTYFPITHYVNYNKFSVHHIIFLATVIAGVEPQSFKNVVTDKGWCIAMQSEIRALEDNGTWTMETLPLGKQELRNIWIYKIKYNSEGMIECLKA